MANFGVGYGDTYGGRKQAVYDDDIIDPASYSRGQQPPNGMGEPHLLGGYNHKYRELIDLIDKLREYGLERELPLPQVAVVGVQTSGKSSVLEGISGLQLPRGTGIVTRCPIELRLKYSGPQGGGWKGRITCENDQGEKMDQALKTPDEVSPQIQRAQQFLAGDHGISLKRVVVEVNSPYVPDLTLVDLPGLIEVAMDNQPRDIVEKVQTIVNHYIKRTETIILVVIPCTMEIATTRGLNMALETDQDGNRTLGVLTKPDLVDKGAEDDIVNMVRTPDRFKIRKGFTIVKMRSKEDVTTGMPLQTALKNEQEWFQNHPQYRQLPKYVLGTRSLATKLTHELVDRIKTILPCLKADVHMKMKEVDEKLDALGRGIPEEDAARRQFLTDLLNSFTEKITRICEGIYDRHVPTDQRLPFRTRPFMEDFAIIVGELMPDESNSYLRERIEREIREQRGMELPGFFSYMACKNTVQRLLDAYMPPSRDCLHKINTVVEEFLHKVTEEKFSAYPALMAQVKEEVDKIQLSQFDKCGKALTEHFDIETMIVIPDVLFYRGQSRAGRSSDRDSDTYSQYNFGDDTVLAPGPGDMPMPDPYQKQQSKSRGFLNRGKKGGAGADTMEKTSTLGPPAPSTVYIPAAENETRGNAEMTLDKIVIYFRTALERLMGSIPARIHYHLIHRLSLDVKSRVTNLGTDVVTLENLVEDEKTAAIRGELLERHECLQRSLEELNKF